MKAPRFLLVVGGLSLLLAAGCSKEEESPSPPPGEPAASTPAPPGGSGAPAAPGATGSAPAGAPGAITASASGADVFKQKCQGCHGDKGQGVPGSGPGLAKEADEEEAELRNVIENGHDKMPAFKGQLTSEQITAVIAHVRTFGAAAGAGGAGK